MHSGIFSSALHDCVLQAGNDTEIGGYRGGGVAQRKSTWEAYKKKLLVFLVWVFVCFFEAEFLYELAL